MDSGQNKITMIDISASSTLTVIRLRASDGTLDTAREFNDLTTYDLVKVSHPPDSSKLFFTATNSGSNKGYVKLQLPP